MHDATQHWLEHWLDDATGHLATLDSSHREFAQPPEVVVASLVQVLSSTAHLVGIEGYGSVVLFRPERGSRSRRLLVADVRPDADRCVLEISSREAPLETLQERRDEQLSVERILDTLTWRLRGADGVVPEQPEGTTTKAPPAGLEPAT